jgi:hypothetical protein
MGTSAIPSGSSPPFPSFELMRALRSTFTPYSTITLDLITDLPELQGYDSILTITDHDCSKAAFFIPCNKTIDSEGIAKCYAKEVFPHYGPLKRVISNCDPHFASKWTREYVSS